jgi:hypothetical protein
MATIVRDSLSAVVPAAAGGARDPERLTQLLDLDFKRRLWDASYLYLFNIAKLHEFG